jgi:DNA-binding helix-hairpin-helix protein with protein kinase domain
MADYILKVKIAEADIPGMVEWIRSMNVPEEGEEELTPLECAAIVEQILSAHVNRRYQDYLRQQAIDAATIINISTPGE